MKSFILIFCICILAACTNTPENKGIPAKVEAVKPDKVILQTSNDFLFLNSPTPNWDWRTTFSQGDSVTLMPDKTGKSYSSVILKNGRTFSLE